jgi:SpoVK/Ycf46/Vps4 family AAA+-type ATPase
MPTKLSSKTESPAIVWMGLDDLIVRLGDGVDRGGKGMRVVLVGPGGAVNEAVETLAAGVLKARHNMKIFRIDLSQVVSKYIGETEKNLSQLLDRAEKFDVILLFDEGEALASRRTTIQDAHGRYANQEVSYLLQRMEEYPGLVILASNLKDNIDPAFAKRFDFIVDLSVRPPVRRPKTKK